MAQTPAVSNVPMQLTRSSRDPEEIKARLTEWLAQILPEGAEPEVILHAGVDQNGMSSETVILDVTYTDGGTRRTGEYVARVAPSAQDVPVFPEYRLEDQYEAMRLAAEHTDVPVPQVRWFERTGEVLGTPFFLMDRIEGIVPPDVLPYTFGDNWLFDATPEQQQRLMRSSVEVLAKLHAIPDAATRFAFLDPRASGHHGPTPLARNLAKLRGWYEWATGGADEVLPRSALMERALDWLEENLPDNDEAVLVWGDARIGNMMYQDFEPAAVLDWEMASLGPRELDASWIAFAHMVFQEIAGMLELPGMPDFLTREQVAEIYEEASGVELGDFTWYLVYNAVHWGCVFLRTGTRQIHFGEIEAPAETEALFHHRVLFERLLQEVGA